MMKPLLLAAAMAVAAVGAFAQSSFWTKTTEPSSASRLSNAQAIPMSSQFFSLDLAALTNQLSKAPSRESSLRRNDLVVTFPNPDGNLERFSVVEASIMHPDLAAKYPNIKSYAGQGIDDPTATIRFSLDNGNSFHGMVLSGTRSMYLIDPYSADNQNYSVYFRKDLGETMTEFKCMTESAMRPVGKEDLSSARTNDKKLRRYRLALSCTAEYGNIFAGTGTDAQKKANILAQMNISMTRVNGVYEKDLAITMQLVPNNDLLIFFGSTSADPWSGEYNAKTPGIEPHK